MSQKYSGTLPSEKVTKHCLPLVFQISRLGNGCRGWSCRRSVFLAFARCRSWKLARVRSAPSFNLSVPLNDGYLFNVTNEQADGVAEATSHEFASGQKVFGRYTLVKVLGRGGMGIVWLARDEELERNVALKFIPDLMIQDRAVFDQLKRETKRCLELTHPHIVPIDDGGGSERYAHLYEPATAERRAQHTSGRHLFVRCHPLRASHEQTAVLFGQHRSTDLRASCSFDDGTAERIGHRAGPGSAVLVRC